MLGANSRLQNSRTVATSCSWSEVRARSSTGLSYFFGVAVGVGVWHGTCTGEGLVLGAGVVFGAGEVQTTGLGVGTTFRSLGPTWPMKGRCCPKPRMKGTV